MSTVEEILNAAMALGPEEQAELRRRLDVLTNSEENGGSSAEAGAGERAEVKRRLETLPAQADENEAQTDDERQAATDLDQRVQRALYEAGLVSEIKPPITDTSPYRREPITIKGKPLSETVIEERR